MNELSRPWSASLIRKQVVYQDYVREDQYTICTIVYLVSINQTEIICPGHFYGKKELERFI